MSGPAAVARKIFDVHKSAENGDNHDRNHIFSDVQMCLEATFNHHLKKKKDAILEGVKSPKSAESEEQQQEWPCPDWGWGVYMLLAAND